MKFGCSHRTFLSIVKNHTQACLAMWSTAILLHMSPAQTPAVSHVYGTRAAQPRARLVLRIQAVTAPSQIPYIRLILHMQVTQNAGTFKNPLLLQVFPFKFNSILCK